MSYRIKTAKELPPGVQELNPQLTPLVAPLLSPARPMKYRNTFTQVDGIRFHSKLEARRYEALKLERAAGMIMYFIRQTRFDLPGPSYYLADFGICGLDGRFTFEDAKGFPTDTSTLKIKQVEALYGIKIHIRAAA